MRRGKRKRSPRPVPRGNAGRGSAPGGPQSLAAVLPEARFIGGSDIDATAVCDDLEACGPGRVFVARLTPGRDGHRDVPAAVAKGVSGVVVERLVPTADVPQCIVPDASWALARLHQAFAGEPAGSLKVVAVTGTSGKSTTCWLAAAVLTEAGHRVGVLSDLGCLGPDDDAPIAAELTRPEVLAGWLARLRAAGCSHAIVEVSSEMLAAHLLAGVSCDTVVVTNLAEAHLEAHGTRRAYHAVKARAVAALRPGGCLISGADPRGEAFLRRHLPAGSSVITAGLKADRDVRAMPVEGSLFGRTVLTACGGTVVPMTLDTPTVPFVRDAMLAVAVGVRSGVAPEIAVRGIEAAGTVPGRAERLDRGQDAAIFLDTPTSGHALAATLASLRRLTSGRLIVLAEEATIGRIGGDAFSSLVARHADASAVAPGTILADDPVEADLAAYARVDRLLGSLAAGDCCLVLGLPVRFPAPPEPPGGHFPLAMLVDAWLQMAGEPGAEAFRPAA